VAVKQTRTGHYKYVTASRKFPVSYNGATSTEGFLGVKSQQIIYTTGERRAKSCAINILSSPEITGIDSYVVLAIICVWKLDNFDNEMTLNILHLFHIRFIIWSYLF